MRALRVVGISEGGGELSVVLEDSGRQERFTVPADEQLRAAARGDLTRLGQISIELESQLRPREIQARIRAGASVDQVAAAAGVPPQKIERFAYPVLLERSRTAEVAQRAHPMRADGPDTRMLGDVVAHTFGLRGQEYHSAEWDSWKGDDGRWVVALSWRAGRSDNRALWTFQPGAHGGTVTAVDEHAHDLVEGLPARPLRTVGPVIDIPRPDEQPPPAPEEGHALRAAASDIAARRDVSDWSRVAPEPRRPEPRRQAMRSEPVEAPQRESQPYARTGRGEEPATEWPVSQRQSEERDPARGADAAPASAAARAANGTRPSSTPGPGDTTSAGAGAPAAARASAAGAPAAGRQATTGAATPKDDGLRPSAALAPGSAAHAGEAAASGSTATGSTVTDSAANDSAANDSAANDSTTNDSAANDSITNGSTANDSTANDPTTNGPAATDSTTNGPAATGSTATVSTPKGSTATDSAQTDSPQAETAVPSARSPEPESAVDHQRTDAPAAGTGADDVTKPEDSLTEPPAPRQAEPASQAPKRSRKGKPVMPSWDEVLLGVRSQR